MTRVLLDVDGVLGDLPSCAIRWINGHSPLSNVTLDMVHEHDILKCLGLDALQERFDRWCIDTELCRDMPVYPGAKDFVRELRSFAEIVVVTSPYAAVPNWCHHRINWLAEHFGIPKRDVIFAKRKELVAGDVLIDDKLSNVEAYCAAQPGLGIVFDRPWNQGTSHVRAKSYAEALRLVGEMVVPA